MDLLLFLLTELLLISSPLTPAASYIRTDGEDYYFTGFCLEDNKVIANYSSYLQNDNETKNSIRLAVDNTSHNTSVVSQGFKNESSAGSIYVLAQCRGDVLGDGCRECLRNATNNITSQCLDHTKEAMIMHEHCFLRYSDRDFFAQLDTDNMYLDCNNQTITNTTRTEVVEETKALLKNLTGQATSSNTAMYARGYNSTTIGQTAYATVQCMGDLSQADCSSCLGNATEAAFDKCDGKSGAKYFAPSCYLRYQMPYLK